MTTALTLIQAAEEAGVTIMADGDCDCDYIHTDGLCLLVVLPKVKRYLDYITAD